MGSDAEVVTTARAASGPLAGAGRDFVRTVAGMGVGVLAAWLGGRGLDLTPEQQIALVGAVTAAVSSAGAAFGKVARDRGWRIGWLL